MKGIGFERLAVILGGDPAESARTPVVHAHGEEHHQEGGNAGLDVHFLGMKEQPPDGFIDDGDTGQQQQAGFDKGRKIFYFAVPVLVIGIGRLVGYTDRKESHERRDKIQAGMCGL